MSGDMRSKRGKTCAVKSVGYRAEWTTLKPGTLLAVVWVLSKGGEKVAYCLGLKTERVTVLVAYT